MPRGWCYLSLVILAPVSHIWPLDTVYGVSLHPHTHTNLTHRRTDVRRASQFSLCLQFFPVDLSMFCSVSRVTKRLGRCFVSTSCGYRNSRFSLVRFTRYPDSRIAVCRFRCTLSWSACLFPSSVLSKMSSLGITPIHCSRMYHASLKTSLYP